LSDASKNVIQAELRIPVKSGPTTLVYPKWIPGNHSPTVGGKSFSVQVMPEAMKVAYEPHRDLLLTVRNTGYQRAVHIPCLEGEQYPHLARATSVTDLLDEIAKAIPPLL
jgi:Peptidase M61 N-terminal domain